MSPAMIPTKYGDCEGVMLFVDPRTKAIMHYVIAHADPSRLGATKLNKVLWHADVLHYRKFGTTITGQNSYIRMPQGPVPNFAREAIDALKQEKKILERNVPTFAGERREFHSISEPDKTCINSAQIEIILDAIRIICAKSAGQASSDTHDALWEEISNGDQIPVGAASVRPGTLEPDDIEWALKSIDVTNF